MWIIASDDTPHAYTLYRHQAKIIAHLLKTHARLDVRFLPLAEYNELYPDSDDPFRATVLLSGGSLFSFKHPHITLEIENHTNGVELTTDKEVKNETSISDKNGVLSPTAANDRLDSIHSDTPPNAREAFGPMRRSRIGSRSPGREDELRTIRQRTQPTSSE